MTLREIESQSGCKLLVRGKGSMKDKKLVRNTNKNPSSGTQVDFQQILDE
jgi:protein quaking